MRYLSDGTLYTPRTILSMIYEVWWHDIRIGPDFPAAAHPGSGVTNLRSRKSPRQSGRYNERAESSHRSRRNCVQLQSVLQRFRKRRLPDGKRAYTYIYQLYSQ